MSKIRRGCSILTTPDTKNVVLCTVIFSQAMYAAKFRNWTLDQCLDLKKPIEAVYRIITKKWPYSPSCYYTLQPKWGGG